MAWHLFSRKPCPADVVPTKFEISMVLKPQNTNFFMFLLVGNIFAFFCYITNIKRAGVVTVSPQKHGSMASKAYVSNIITVHSALSCIMHNGKGSGKK